MTKPHVLSLDGRLLRLFLEVYECNSVSRAAERLGLTQSTVSHGLDRLRRSLDDPLFVKDGRSITPTAHAVYLAPQIREALSALESLAEPQTYDPATDTHPVTIAANAPELQPELVALYRRIRAGAPMMPVRFVHLGTHVNYRPILDDAQADIVIGVRAGGYPAEYGIQHFLTERMVIFYDPECRGPVTSIEDFTAARHAALDFGGGRPSLLDRQMQDLNLARNVVLHASNVQLLGGLLRGTDMICTLQERFGNSMLQGLATCDAPLNLPMIHYDILWHSRNSLSKRHAWLRSQIIPDAGDTED